MNGPRGCLFFCCLCCQCQQIDAQRPLDVVLLHTHVLAVLLHARTVNLRIKGTEWQMSERTTRRWGWSRKRRKSVEPWRIDTTLLYYRILFSGCLFFSLLLSYSLSLSPCLEILSIRHHLTHLEPRWRGSIILYSSSTRQTVFLCTSWLRPDDCTFRTMTYSRVGLFL